MNVLAIRLITRLVFVQLAVCFFTELLVAAFAPRLLLLEDSVLEAVVPQALWCGGLILAFEVAVTLVVTRRLRPCLRALGVGSAAVDPRDVVALYQLPARLTILDVVGSFVIITATLFRPVRSMQVDLPTQAELLLLTVTMGSVAALVGYVTMRSAVAKVLELVPEVVSRDAIALTELAPSPVPRVRLRFLFAVTFPVTFVALGASLLVVAHVRSFEVTAREQEATELARATLDLVAGTAIGRKEAVQAAAASGYLLEVTQGTAPFHVTRGEGGQAVVTVPLEDGHATVRWSARALSPAMVVYALLATAVAMLAALLGSRIGAAFVGDVSLVTKEVRNLGVADVLRGTRVQRGARFTSMGALVTVIDELGTIFREFASTQERAIDAKAAAERMRGMFLASMSHDLKAPLNAILGFAELASRSPLTASQRESLTIIEQRGKELLHLIQTILDAGRVEAGELALAREPVLVGELIMSAIIEARELTAEAEVDIFGEMEPGVPRLLVDVMRVVQALTLVILTGARFAEQGVVRVRAAPPGNDALQRIEVEVPGRGVAREDLDTLFQAFKDPERARKHGSLGLGLSLARSIVELHGGSLEASARGQSTTVFLLALPSAGASAPGSLGRMGVPSAPTLS